MQLLSVNIGRPSPLLVGKRTDITGIFKQPAAHPAWIGFEGLRGDAVMDAKNHGGPDQAVFVYTSEDYAWWSEQLGREMRPGEFGENLTASGMLSGEMLIGDLLRIGSVVLQVTAPRYPCSTLAAAMGDPAFVKRYREAERPGFYCRVQAEGEVASGYTIWHERFAGETLSILEMFRSHYDAGESEEMIRRHLAAPIGARNRSEQEERLRKPRQG